MLYKKRINQVNNNHNLKMKPNNRNKNQNKKNVAKRRIRNNLIFQKNQTWNLKIWNEKNKINMNKLISFYNFK